MELKYKTLMTGGIWYMIFYKRMYMGYLMNIEQMKQVIEIN
jgi:hypothetical protein